MPLRPARVKGLFALCEERSTQRHRGTGFAGSLVSPLLRGVAPKATQGVLHALPGLPSMPTMRGVLIFTPLMTFFSRR